MMRKFAKNYLVYVILALIIVLIAAFSSSMSLSIKLFIPNLPVIIILAISLNLIVGFLGELSLGHAGFMSIGAFLGGMTAKLLLEKVPLFESFKSDNLLIFAIAIAVGAVCAALCGFVVGFAALRLRGDYLAIVTLGFGEIVRVIFMNSSAETFGGATGLKSPSFPTSKFPMLTIIGLLFVMFTIFVIKNLLKSKTGRAITAIRDNEIAAKAMGIDVTKHKLMVFVIAAAFAGVAGVLFSYANTPVKPDTFDYNYSIEILIIVVLGGMGNINGSIIAATLITLLNTGLTKYFKDDAALYKDFLYAIILILVIIYNNAPAFKKFRERYNLKTLYTKVFKPKHNPAKDKGDAARWDVVPTKIEMNEVLSTDVVIDSTGDNSADIGERGGNK